MEEIPYYTSFALTTLLCGIATVSCRKKVILGTLSEKRAKHLYSRIAALIACCGGTLIFHGLVYLFGLVGIKAAFGHGEIVIAAFLYNLILGLLLIVVGRAIIGWEKLSW